jgi:sugar transferase (PEP-CTERM system associated)
MIRLFEQYISVKSILLMTLESLLIALSLICAAGLRFWTSPLEFEAYVSDSIFPLQLLTVVVIFQICFYCNDLYDLNSQLSRYEQVISIERSLGAACIFLGALYFAVPDLLMGRGVLVIGVVLASAFTVLARVTLDGAWAVAARQRRILIVGTRELAQAVAREVVKRQDLNLRLVGLIDPETAETGDQGKLLGHAVLGSTAELERLVSDRRISMVVVALEDRRGKLPTRDLVKVRVGGVSVLDAHSAIAALSGRVWLSAVNPSWFVFSDGFRRSTATLAIKRAIDFVSALTGLLICWPVMLLIAAAIRLDSDGPALYRQVRVGFRGRQFELLKFRSMRVDAEKEAGPQWARQADNRVTRIGKHLRKFRLDELPQFFNILRGDMSLVGPRPERPVFVEQIRQKIAYYDERHSVRPGLTGWAQVQYHYGASIEDALRKLEYDLFYLKNMSILFDGAILFQTIRTVLTGSGGR